MMLAFASKPAAPTAVVEPVDAVEIDASAVVACATDALSLPATAPYDDAKHGPHFAGLLRMDAANDDAGAQQADGLDDATSAAALDGDAEQRDRDPDQFAPKRRLARLIGPRLIAARELAGLQQTDAAARLGYATPAQLSLWEQSRRLIPMPELIKAARVYGVSLDYLACFTAEPERDPARALRAACVRGLRGMIDGLAVGLVDSISGHAAAVGPDVVSARAVLSSGKALLDALGVVQRKAEFDEIRGAATVNRVALEFEARLDEVRAAIDRFDKLDIALRERIAHAVAANDAALDDEAE